MGKAALTIFNVAALGGALWTACDAYQGYTAAHPITATQMVSCMFFSANVARLCLRDLAHRD